MKRIIIFLIRKKLGLKKYQRFQFTNQTDKTIYYYFESKRIVKELYNGCTVTSSVSLNWLMNEECDITKFDNRRK